MVPVRNVLKIFDQYCIMSPTPIVRIKVKELALYLTELDHDSVVFAVVVPDDEHAKETKHPDDRILDYIRDHGEY